MFKRITMLVASGLLCVGWPAASEIPLGGAQDGHYDKDEYVVDSLVVVGRGTTMSLAPGSVIRFKRFAALRVLGALECRGTSWDPITFTSDNDRDGHSASPAPFDWTGVLAEGDDARLRLEHVRIQYSTVGLKVESPRARVKLDSVRFEQNGTGDFSVGDSTIAVAPGSPVTYPPQLSTAQDTVASLGLSAQAAGTPVKRRWKVPVRISGAAVAAAGLGMAVIGEVLARGYVDDYNDPGATTAQVDEAERKGTNAILVRNIGYAVLGTGAVAVAVTLFF
ncbi:MAG: hypothetical protein GF331_23690 [Chitinivibrionales bacterium]|nr:hypothetical protein [Chitinivibrionales bacterium]